MFAASRTPGVLNGAAASTGSSNNGAANVAANDLAMLDSRLENWVLVSLYAGRDDSNGLAYFSASLCNLRSSASTSVARRVIYRSGEVRYDPPPRSLPSE